jgi:hypothetical protein
MNFIGVIGGTNKELGDMHCEQYDITTTHGLVLLLVNSSLELGPFSSNPIVIFVHQLLVSSGAGSYQLAQGYV